MADWYNKTGVISGGTDRGRSAERDQEQCQVPVGDMGAVNAEGVKGSPSSGDLAHPTRQCPTLKRPKGVDSWES